MRSEKEIREMLSRIREILRENYIVCGKDELSDICVLPAVIKTLEWVLGEREDPM